MHPTRLAVALAVLVAAASPPRVQATTSAAASGWCAVWAYRPGAAEDQVPVRIETVGHPDGSTTYTFGCGSSDYFTFGPGLQQNFGASAWVGGFGEAGNGVLRAFLRVGASVSPKGYGYGAIGPSPFHAKASGNTGAGLSDVFVVPPTAGARNPGDPTTISLVARLTCKETGLYPVEWDTDSVVSAGFSDAAGNYIDGVIFHTQLSYGRSLCQPLSNDMFPRVISTTVGASLTMTGGLGLSVSTVYGTDANIGDLEAYTDATSTATFAVRSADGTPLVGASGVVYDGTAGTLPPLTTPTSTSTTTSTTATTTTLPGCAGTCGDGMLEAACGEACECPPTTDPIALGFGCTGDAVIPAQAVCAICRGCRIDTHICDAQVASTTSTTIAGGSTTTSTTVPGASVTTTTVTASTSTTLPEPPCQALAGIARARCRLDVALAGSLCAGEAVPAKLDGGVRARLRVVVARLDAAVTAEGKKRARLLKKVRGPLGAVDRKAAAAAKSKQASKRLSPSCSGAIGGLVAAVRADLS